MSRPPQQAYPRNGSGQGGSSTTSRAERFEDEKRRIIESCFSKQDANGQLAESYITHIRIVEDAQHPSSPPPPESGPENKKPRLIIVAVRSNGRVRMHKARENNNGSFSIGKTWNMEELSAIETFSSAGMPPSTSEKEQRYRDWAGNIGFTVTVTKPYYWQAGTAKEKDFFIASCIKIYRKYTKGLVPDLRGFSESEKASMTGNQAPAPGDRKPANSAAVANAPLSPPLAPFAREGTSSRDASPYRGSPGPSPYGEKRRPSDSPARAPRGPPNGGFGQPPSGPRPFASQEQMRVSPQPYPTRDGTPNSLRPGTSPGPRPSPGTGMGPGRGLLPSASTRDASPGVSSIASSHRSGVTSAVNQNQSIQSRNYSRNPDFPDSQQPLPPNALDGEVSSPAAAGAFHSSLYGQSRSSDDYQQSQNPPLQQVRAENQHIRLQQSSSSRSGTPQLPPIETNHPLPSFKEDQGTPKPGTAEESEASSAGIDINDAAAISALTGFWGPDAGKVTPQATPRIEETASPPTPERSARRRPLLEERNATSDSNDLRPPPLGSVRSRSPNDEASRYGTPQGNSVAASPGMPSPALSSGSAQPTPRQEQFSFEPEAPKPLFQRRQQTESGSNPHLPGAFATPPFSDSPVGTPTNDHVRPLAPQPRPRSPPAQEPIKPISSSASQARDGDNVKVGEFIDEVKPSIPASEQSKDPQTTAGIPSAEQYRPGLGPMIRKGNAADKFRSAARAANAFKPRPGGAAEKILKAKAEREANGDADGISGVFKPKAKIEEPTEIPVPTEEQLPKVQPLERQGTDLSVKSLGSGLSSTPLVQVHSPVSPVRDDNSLAALEGIQKSVQLIDSPNGTLQPDSPGDTKEQEEDKHEQRNLRTPQSKVKRRSFQQERYLTELGIDRSLLEGKALDFEILLGDFGWSATTTKPKSVNELESAIKREVGKIEAGAWLSHSDVQREEKIGQVDTLLERCIAECDELEGLLTLYSVELGSLNEDIAFIEAQSQGLQVQSANQKLLHTELASLLETTNLDRRMLEPLRFGDLSDDRSLENIESSLVKLYQAMVTMDPTIRSGGSTDYRPGSKGGISSSDSELARMKALREKRVVYERECAAFCDRFAQHLDFVFTNTLNGARDRVLRPVSSGGASNGAQGLKRLDRGAFANARAGFWTYSPLILFTKEVNRPTWGSLLQIYHLRARPLYEGCFKESIAGWKRTVRRNAGDESDILFTSQDKEIAEVSTGSGGLSSTARKLTVKRSQTLAKTLRQASGGDKYGASDHSRTPGAMMSSEVFASAMDEMAPLISQEQNFIVDLFHATSLETSDFADAVSAYPPESRRGTNLLAGRHVEPDREMAFRISNTMDEIFGFFTTEVGQMLDWALSMDPIQGVGVMASLSKHAYYLQAQNQSQEWLISMIDGLSTRLQTLFSRFIEEQIRSIEDTKVKIKKRKGVISFMKIFPHFSAATENVLSAIAGQDYEHNHASIGDVRRLIDNAYAQVNRAMFDSLKVIAKESPAAQQPGGAGAQGPKAGQSDDPEDKEMLNYQILIIENMNHYIEEVDDRGKSGSVLAEWRERAQKERREALDAYINRVIRRPLGKLLDWLDTADSILRTSTSDTPLASRQNYSRKAARNLLSQYDGKEIRRSIDTLRKRIEKHFGDADEEAISRSLVNLVGKECEAAYETTLGRLEALRRECYASVEGEKNVEIAFERGDIQAGFRR